MAIILKKNSTFLTIGVIKDVKELGLANILSIILVIVNFFSIKICSKACLIKLNERHNSKSDL